MVIGDLYGYDDPKDAAGKSSFMYLCRSFVDPLKLRKEA